MRLSLLSLLPLALAIPTSHVSRADKPVYWVLAGDSTTAQVGGWGNAFLSTTVAKPSDGVNHAYRGRTTRSFRNSGDWNKVLASIASHKNDYRVHVTIQFGHNDQKEGSGVTLEDYAKNLGTFAKEVVNAGATPILVTPLTRRVFDSSTNKVVENLGWQRDKTIEVAKSDNRFKWIDLNQASTKYVNAIGQAATVPYNLYGTDRTHLSPWGEKVFARMVSDLLVAKYASDFESATVKNQTMSALIAAGKPA